MLKAESEDTPKILKSRGSVNLESKLGVCVWGGVYDVYDMETK